MNFIYDIIPEEFIKAIGWMIFHSLWQGAVIAFLLGIILLFTKSNNSRLRYNLSAAALFFLFGISLITFIRVYDTSADGLSVHAGARITNNISTLTNDGSVSSDTMSNPDLIDNVKSYFAGQMPFIVTLWLFGFLLFSLRFIGGALLVQKLRTEGINPLSDSWTARLRELSGRIGLSRAVKIFESSRVKTPVTIGYLKPIILFPIGIISGLPQDQIEAIIIHELTHIKRYDFLINFLQAFIETLLFYHPAVWWISSTIKNERENCCDDNTLELCGGSLIYFKALYNLQQISSTENELALAAIGKKNQLFRRINRMNSNNKSRSYGFKFAAFAVLLTIIAAASVYSTSSVSEGRYNSASVLTVPGILQPSEITPFESAADYIESADTISLKKGKQTFRFSEEGKRYKAKLNNGKVEGLYIDGDKIEEKELSKYEGMVNQRLNEYDAAMSDYNDSMKEYKEKMKSFREKMKKFRGTYSYDFDFDLPVPPAHISIPDMDTTEIRKMVKDIQKAVHENLVRHPIRIPRIHIPKIEMDSICINMKDFHFDNEEFQESMKEWKGNMKDFKFDNEAFGKSMAEWKEKFKEEMKNWKPDVEKLKFDTEKFREEMKKSGPGSEAFRKSMEDLKVNMGNLKIEMKKLKGFNRETKDELVKDKLLNEGDDLENFTLSKDQMIIDGKKVSPELHKKYLEIYKKNFGKDLTGDKKFRIND